nr:MAG TPA: hypothetical protein [Caudoviricetes sp.]
MKEFRPSPGIAGGGAAFSFCSGFYRSSLRGRPPPTPRPGRAAFHRSMVSGSHPRVVPIIASGSGSL